MLQWYLSKYKLRNIHFSSQFFSCKKRPLLIISSLKCNSSSSNQIENTGYGMMLIIIDTYLLTTFQKSLYYPSRNIPISTYISLCKDILDYKQANFILYLTLILYNLFIFNIFNIWISVKYQSYTIYSLFQLVHVIIWTNISITTVWLSY